jgi:Na+/H+ antiporter NhaD/arsenite permease-like protein
VIDLSVMKTALTVLPFALMLAAIAFGPAMAPHWWESNRNRLLVSLVLGLPVAAVYLVRAPAALGHALGEYAAFIVVLGALYVIAGGVVLHGDLRATPLVNVAFLATGAVLASVVGTTGAAMLLIRPLLRTNRERTRVTHTVVFFIFIVANVGGLLTPLGDPPLLLGYLVGVPFTWTLRLWPAWLLMVGALLAVYVAWDMVLVRREPAEALGHDRAHIEPLRLAGNLNLLWLAGVVAAVVALSAPWRELVILAFAALAYVTSQPERRRLNRFTFSPILEVAAIFLGIFLTIEPALELLRRHGGELGVREPLAFFWSTGVLSAVLDNAPTYLAFLAIAQGLGLAAEVVGVPHTILAGISLGAVAFGALTYIGNAPNFMVRAIAVETGVSMPGFAGYLAYSLPVLIPLFALVGALFLAR